MFWGFPHNILDYTWSSLLPASREGLRTILSFPAPHHPRHYRPFATTQTFGSRVYHRYYVGDWQLHNRTGPDLVFPTNSGVAHNSVFPKRSRSLILSGNIWVDYWEEGQRIEGRDLFFLPSTLCSRSALVSIILHSQSALVPVHRRATLSVCKSRKSLWMGEVF